MFAALRAFGLPVPQVLAGPIENEAGQCCAIYSVLPGRNLQKLGSQSQDGLDRAKLLLVEAVRLLSSATSVMANQETFAMLPRLTLRSELGAITEGGGDWLADPLFRTAVPTVLAEVRSITTPLVFTNGDYQPGNFLADGGRITGLLDFQYASFQDPLMGFVKYPIYDLLPLSRTDMIDWALAATGFSRRDFATRLALGSLKTLNRDIPRSGGDEETARYRDGVVAILRRELAELTDTQLDRPHRLLAEQQLPNGAA